MHKIMAIIAVRTASFWDWAILRTFPFTYDYITEHLIIVY